MNTELEKIFRLVQKTGDNFVVKDKDSSYVIMSLEAYEKLLDQPASNATVAEPIESLTEEQLLAKITEEISKWKQNTNTASYEQGNSNSFN